MNPLHYQKRLWLQEARRDVTALKVEAFADE